jgi:hypothetical protein
MWRAPSVRKSYGFECHPAASAFVIRGSDWARERVGFAAVTTVEVTPKGADLFISPASLSFPRVLLYAIASEL